jgi:hypothetical protein
MRLKYIKRPLKANQLMRERLFESEQGKVAALKMRRMKSCRGMATHTAPDFLISATFLGFQAPKAIKLGKCHCAVARNHFPPFLLEEVKFRVVLNWPEFPTPESTSWKLPEWKMAERRCPKRIALTQNLTKRNSPEFYKFANAWIFIFIILACLFF